MYHDFSLKIYHGIIFKYAEFALGHTETFYALAAPATVANNGSGNNGYTVCIWVG